MSVRVRFAPSPTGHLHIGGLRAALFNWLYARHHGGVFLLRIEDTDVKRSLVEYTASIMESLDWVGLNADEPIVVQSERFSEHARLIKQLLSEGKAYKCYCTQEDVAQRVGGQEGERHYDGFCRTAPEQDKPFVIRFKLPTKEGAVTFNDLIRDTVSFAYEQMDDFIIARSDGIPMYNFVVVADDAFMRITHVIRGEEHLVNTPKQILLYQAFGWTVPQFAHLPLILGPSGSKLSKRDAATSVLDYKKEGFLPHALINYLVRLGWGHKDQEIFTTEELIRLFDLDAIGKKGAIFDVQKLHWLNNHYMKQLTAEHIIEMTVTQVEPDFVTNVSGFTQLQLHVLLDLYKERCNTLRELATVVHALQRPPMSYPIEELNEYDKPTMPELITAYAQMLTALSPWDVDTVTKATKTFVAERGIKMPELAYPVRLALVGAVNAPSLFALVHLFGATEIMRRVTLFLKVYDTIER